MLFRKLLRELLQQKWQYAAVASMLILGVSFFAGSYISYLNLHTSYEYSYEKLQFEDFGVKIQNAPRRVATRLERIPGVVAAEGRLVEDVGIELSGLESRRLVGRLISLPVPAEPILNKYVLLEGRPISSTSAREVLLESRFAEYHGLRPGDEIAIHRMGDRVWFRIAGIVSSPEYIYVVQSKQDLLPMPDTFGVMFIAEDVLGSLVNKLGLINEIRLKTSGGPPSDQILQAVTSSLSEYRPEKPILREEQPSHQLLQQDLEGFRTYAILFPLFFLTVASLTVYTILSRLVTTQQPIIGLLRSLGIDRRTIVFHYVSGAILVGAVSALFGSLLGLWFSQLITEWYFTFIAVPFAKLETPIAPLAVAMVGGVGSCLLAAIFPARAAARIEPAEAMRPAPPTVIGAVTIDRLLPGLPLLWRIPMRNLFRQPKRLVSSLFGVTASIALIMTGMGLIDSMDEALSAISVGTFQEDLTVGFIGFATQKDLSSISSLPGVVHAEGMLELPVDFHKDGRTYSGLLTGVMDGSLLVQLEDEQGKPIQITNDLVVGRTIQSHLGLETGDKLTVSLPAGEILENPSTREVRAGAINWEPIGTVAYTSLDEIWRLFRTDLSLPNGAITSVRAKVDPGHELEIKRQIESMPQIGAVISKSEVQSMIDDMSQASRTFVGFMLLFGTALAFSVIFNVITINVMERTQEIATMRTIGISLRSVIAIVTFENVLVSLIGIAIGLPLGRLFVEYFLTAAQSAEQQELFAMRLHIEPRTYLISAVLIVLTVLVSQLPALRHIAKLTLAKAINERTS